MRIETYIEVLRLLDVEKNVTTLQLTGVLLKSRSQLERVMRELKKCKLVKPKLGQGGGYVLAQPYTTIKMIDILPLFDERDKLAYSMAERLHSQFVSSLYE